MPDRQSCGIVIGDANLEVLMKFHVLLQQDEDGVFVAEVPSLPDCISQVTPGPPRWPTSAKQSRDT